MISRIGWVKRVRISDMFAPYNTDSRVGRVETEMGGLKFEGMNLDEKNVRIHANMGVAGMKNCEVSGMRRAIVYRMGMPSLKGNGGEVIIVNQNVARSIWKT